MKKIRITGGTLEYYIDHYVISEEAKKQDYFALGSILFFIKYDKDLLKCKKN